MNDGNSFDCCTLANQNRNIFRPAKRRESRVKCRPVGFVLKLVLAVSSAACITVSMNVLSRKLKKP
jgi:hypothetical protein